MKLTTKALAIGAVACALGLPAGGQGVPTIDVSSLAKLADQLVEAKLQLKEQIAQNLKLDEQTKQLVQQITLLQDQIAALRNGLTLADLGIDPETFLRDILPDFSDLTASMEAARSGDWTRVLASGDAFRGGGTVTGHVDRTFFERTKTLFEAWLTAFVGYLMYPIAAAAVIGAVVSMADAQFMEQAEVETISMILGFLCVTFVGIFALLAIPTAAAHITGSFNLANFVPEALRVVNKPTSMLGGRIADAVKPRAEALESGFRTGKTPGLAARARDREWAEKGAEWRRKMRGIEIMQGKRD